MSKRTFKKRKKRLYLNFVNYKFINLRIFTPPQFYEFLHFAIRFISSAKIRLFRFLPMRFVRFAWIREIKCEKYHGIIQKNISEEYEIISER